MSMIDYLQQTQITSEKFLHCIMLLKRLQSAIYHRNTQTGQSNDQTLYPFTSEMSNNQMLVARYLLNFIDLKCKLLNPQLVQNLHQQSFQLTPSLALLKSKSQPGFAVQIPRGLFPQSIVGPPSASFLLPHQGYPEIAVVDRCQSVQLVPKLVSQTNQRTPTQGVKKRIKRSKDELREAIKNRELKETKNIPKNFSKAIITFCIKNREFCAARIGPGIDYDEFLRVLKLEKKSICNIQQFQRLLADDVDDEKQRQFNSIFRRIGYQVKSISRAYFLKNHAVSYIFHSRIVQVNWHLKYRMNMLKAIRNPKRFRQIKYMF